MKYSVPILALALTAVADPSATLKKAAAVRRDLPTVTSVLAQVNELTGKLDTAITGFSSDYGSVESAAQALNEAVTSGISAVSGSPELTLTDALGVQAPVQDLTKTVEKTVDDTIAQKEAFVAAGKGGDVLKTLQDQKSGADELSKTISGKVPQEVAGLAATLSAGISNALQKGIDSYQDQAGASSSGSSSSGSSSGTAPAASSASDSGSSATASGSASGTASGSTSSSSDSSDMSSMPGMSGSSSSSSGGAATTSAPAQFTGAGSVNSFSVAGVLAAVAVVLAF